jgi:ArsR family transcriptional regulator
VARRSLDLIEENGRWLAGLGADEAGRISVLGAALSDPIRVRMLGMMAVGRGCCELPDCGVPAEDQDAGICVCEFERAFDIGQSKVSYHLRKLKEAGLVREERRGRWSFYSLDRETAVRLFGEMEGLLGRATRSGREPVNGPISARGSTED